jgi:hypothetical protein
MRAWLVVAVAIGVIAPAALLIGEPASSTPEHRISVAGTKPAPISASLDTQARAALVRAISEKSTFGPKTTHRRVAHLDGRLQAAAASGHASTTKVAVTGSPGQIVAAVRKLGGSVDATTPAAVSASVPSTSLASLAASPGVSQVSPPERAFIQDASCTSGCSQGVSDSGASNWQSSADTGANVTIGIVDGGFENLAAEQTAGNLPPNGPQLIYKTGNGNPTSNDRCANDNASPHGTAVAEIIHQMAPSATLVLECVDNSVEFQAAGAELASTYGAQIVSSSLAFPADSRGDGTGDADSAATTVETARKAGILWIQSAGNNATDHWSGTFNRDSAGLVNLDPKHQAVKSGQGINPDVDAVAVAGHGQAEVVLQWDQWPMSSAGVTLIAQGLQCNADCTSTSPIAGTPDCNSPNPQYCLTQASGTSPTLVIDISNTSADEQVWSVGIEVAAGTPALQYDLSYWGDVSSNVLDCDAAGTNSQTCYSPVSAAGSITAPASSPYAMAVGAADGSGDNVCDSDLPGSAASGDSGTYPLEAFSSTGPTIDGRVKPDILAFDGVDSNEYPEGFCGTSAAAPHVAGAAALALSADLSLDAAQLQAFLEQRASGGVATVPNNPPTNQAGRGVLDLGAVPPISAPTPSTYTALSSPVRALDTRVNHGKPLGAGKTVTMPIPSSVQLPLDATAVAINLTAVTATGTAYLSAYPAGAAFPGTSNINVSSTDPTAAVFAVVTLGANRSIQILNGGTGQTTVGVVVDVLGYFSPSTAGWKYSSVTASRLLDTRTSSGGASPLGPLTVGRTVTVHTGLTVPPGGAAAVVNVTVANQHGTGWLHLDNATPTQPIQTSTLNYMGYNRANLAVVDLDPNGDFTVTDGGAGYADVVVDLLGVFSSSGLSSYVALPSPIRIVDTRSGNGGVHSALGNAATMTAFAAGLGEISSKATALLVGVIAVPSIKVPASYFTVYPAGAGARPSTSTLNFSGLRVVPNAAIANLNPQMYSLSLYNNEAAANAVIDVFGYFL